MGSPQTTSTLNQAQPNQLVKIVGIDNPHLANKLFAMGLLPGASIKVIRHYWLSGNCYVQSNNLTLALRNWEAKAVQVTW